MFYSGAALNTEYLLYESQMCAYNSRTVLYIYSAIHSSLHKVYNQQLHEKCIS